MITVSKNTIQLLRIPFSLYLAPVFLLAMSQSPAINIFTSVCSFVIIHLLVYPASNGYNSYIDKDEGSIGGLEKPPMPTRELFHTTLLLDISAVILSLICVNAIFSLCVLLYILASRSYSAPQVRLKKHPIAGFLVVVVFQGAFTCFMAIAGISGKTPPAAEALLWLLLACSLQIAGAYPLTQVYQHEADRASGDITLSLKLGIRGTFIFTTLMFVLCNIVYYIYFNKVDRLLHFYLLQVFFLPVIAFFAVWFIKVLKNRSAASFKNAMTMNAVAALSSGACFLLLIFLKP